jgi:hypothetical protein
VIVHQPPTRHPPTPVKVAIMSGLSDPTTCALSEVQRRFMAAVRVPERWKVYWNFPYVPSARDRHDPPLWLASARNGWQYLLASAPGYRTAARRHWRALADSTGHLVVVTLSCGLEILNHLLGPEDEGKRLDVIALGPVASGRPRTPATLVQGTADYVSRLFFRRRDVSLPGVQHLDYFHHPHVLELTNRRLGHVAAL